MSHPGRALALSILALLATAPVHATAAEPADATEAGSVQAPAAAPDRAAEDELAASPASPAKEPGTGWTLFPVPFVSTNPNEGTKYGLILALLSQEKGYTKGICAPSVSYSKRLGLQGTFRYYGYPRPGVKFVTIGSYGTEQDQEYYLYYDDRTLGSNIYEAEGTAFMNNTRSARFYGLGSDMSEGNETNFTLQDFGGTARGGLKLGEHLQISVSPRVRKVNLLKGVNPNLPSPSEKLPGTPGLGGATTVAWKAQLVYDTRDNVDIPAEGVYASGFGEISLAALGSHSSFERYGIDTRAFFSGQSRKFVTAVRGLAEIVVGSSVPFFELSQLGGSRQLRAFPEGRWTDKGKILVTVEERVRVLELTIFDVFTQLELSAFGDLGKVFRVTDRFFEDFQPVGGVGLRFLVPPNVVATVDAGYGTEGLAIYAILGYPF